MGGGLTEARAAASIGSSATVVLVAVAMSARGLAADIVWVNVWVAAAFALVAAVVWPAGVRAALLACLIWPVCGVVLPGWSRGGQDGLSGGFGAGAGATVLVVAGLLIAVAIPVGLRWFPSPWFRWAIGVAVVVAGTVVVGSYQSLGWVVLQAATFSLLFVISGALLTQRAARQPDRRRAVPPWSAASSLADSIGPWNVRHHWCLVVALTAIPFQIGGLAGRHYGALVEWIVVLATAFVWTVVLAPRWGRGPSGPRTPVAAAVLLVIVASVGLTVMTDWTGPILLILAAASVAVAVLVDPAAPLLGEVGEHLIEGAKPAIVAARLARRGGSRVVAPLRKLARPTRDAGRSDEPPRRRYGVPVLVWAGTAALVNLVVGVAADFPTDNLLGLSAAWGHWDSLAYVEIAERGYSWNPGHQAGTTIAWFPLYPLLMRALHPIITDWHVAGWTMTVVGGLAAVLLFWKFLALKGTSGRAQVAALLVLVVYPWSFMLYGAVYADVISLALILGAFVALETGHPIGAGLLGALATASRPTALPLIVGLAIAVLERDAVLTFVLDAGERARVRVDRARLRASQAGVLLSLGGVGGLAWYCDRRWGDPLLFYQVEHYWGHGSALDVRTWLKVTYLQQFWHVGNGHANDVNSLAAAAISIGCLALLPAIARRYGVGYAAFVLGVVATNLIGAEIFTPGARHLLVAFPAMGVVGEWLADRPRIARPAFIGSAATMLVLAWIYGSAYTNIGF